MDPSQEGVVAQHHHHQWELCASSGFIVPTLVPSLWMGDNISFASVDAMDVQVNMGLILSWN